MKGNVTEIVLFRLKPEVSRGVFLEESDRVCDWLEKRPGHRGGCVS